MGHFFSFDHVAQWAVGQAPGPIFSPIFFMLHLFKCLFSLGQTQPNGFIIGPHPQLDLDTFKFVVLAHLAALWTVFLPQPAKVGLLGPKNQFWALKYIFCGCLPKLFVPP